MKNRSDNNAVDFFIKKSLFYTLADEVSKSGGRKNFSNEWEVTDSVGATWCRRTASPLMSLVNDTRNAMDALKDFVDSIEKIDANPTEGLPRAKRYYEDTSIRFKGLEEKFKAAIKKLRADGVIDELKLTDRDYQEPIVPFIKITKSYRGERNKYAHSESFSIMDDALILFMSVIDPSAHSLLLSSMGKTSLGELINNAKKSLTREANKFYEDAVIMESSFAGFCEVFKNALSVSYPDC